MSSPTQHRVTLSKLQRAIKELNGSELSDELKSLAVSAVQAGNSRRLVASIVGVTGRTIGNWRSRKFKLRAEPNPVQLKIVRERAPFVSVPKPQTACGIAKIFFKSGIVVELPTSLLGASLIADLNGVSE